MYVGIKSIMVYRCMKTLTEIQRTMNCSGIFCAIVLNCLKKWAEVGNQSDVKLL